MNQHTVTQLRGFTLKYLDTYAVGKFAYVQINKAVKLGAPCLQQPFRHVTAAEGGLDKVPQILHCPPSESNRLSPILEAKKKPQTTFCHSDRYRSHEHVGTAQQLEATKAP